MARLKESKNKKKEILKTLVKKEVIQKEPEKLKILLHNLDTLTTEVKEKIGISVSYGNVEFNIFVNSADKKFEIGCHTSGIISDNARLKLLREQEFKIKLSPSNFKKILDYIAQTPIDKIEKNLKTVKKELKEQ